MTKYGVHMTFSQTVILKADDLPDDRSTALKVLHEALPERVKDLPTSKQKFKVQVLASKLRSMVCLYC